MPSHTPRQIIAGTDVLESFKTIDQRMWIPEEIVSRIHTAMTAAGWEDMLSLPKDGSEFIVVLPDGTVRTGAWGLGTIMLGPFGTTARSDNWPTHWRHLPPPPKAIEP